jgi:hypothetical protein
MTPAATAVFDFATLEAELETTCAKLDALAESSRGGWSYEPTKDEVAARAAQKRQAEKAKNALVPRWQEVDRRATDDEIALHLGLMAGGFLNLGKAEVDLFIQLMAADISALKPTPYELAVAARAVRSKYEFLSIKAVVKEIKRAKVKAFDRRATLTGVLRMKGGLLEADYYNED